MKIRSDYVTNSSSSCFVIGKKEDETVTIESVYQTLRGFYKDYTAKRDALLQYITDNPQLGMVYKAYERGFYRFAFMNEEVSEEKQKEIADAIEKEFGISTWDKFKDYDWLDCETYRDYEQYWVKKINKDKFNFDAPFTIADFLENKEIFWLHCIWDDLLGRTCIYTDDNVIPHYIVEKLEDISEWYCSHM